MTPQPRNPRSVFFLLLLVLLIAAPLLAASHRPYHLRLAAHPAAPFPFLGKFGTVSLDVYPSGVRAETIWLNGFSRNGTSTVTVENPYGRMYTNMPIADIGATLQKFGKDETASTVAIPPRAPEIGGKVGGIDAHRYRLVYGPAAWIDVWTTTVIPENPQLRAIVNEFVRGVSPATATAMRSIPGMPLYVELNFRRYKKLPILTLEHLSFDDVGEEDALKVGRLYFKAPLLDSLWK